MELPGVGFRHRIAGGGGYKLGGPRLGGWNDIEGGGGARSIAREGADGFGAKKLEIELRGSISRVPLKTAPGIDYQGQWGAVDQMDGLLGVPIQS